MERGLDDGGTVVHLSVHSFTPFLDGRERRTDLAFLYDPARAGERTLARRWVEELRTRIPERSIRRNHPYRGVSDGLTTWLRRATGSDRYLGVEVEVNQRWAGPDDRFPPWIPKTLVSTLGQALAGEPEAAGGHRR